MSGPRMRFVDRSVVFVQAGVQFKCKTQQKMFDRKNVSFYKITNSYDTIKKQRRNKLFYLLTRFI